MGLNPRSAPLATAIPRPLRDAARALSLVAPLLGSGCIVHVYQPLSGLHRPVVVDPQVPNFQDVHLTVYCVPGDLLTLAEASALCQKVGTLFENQGALVTTTVGGSPAEEETLAEAAPEALRTDLTIELRARKVHAATHPWSWAATVVSFTLVPGVTESTFAQDLVIRDGNGFLLATDTLEGRLVHYFGFGMWAGNKLLDVTFREKEDEIIGPIAGTDLSADLYRQLSQSVFDAKLQWLVLREADGRGDPAR